MTQSPLHGLNIIHPTAREHSYTSDSQDLLTAPPFPDLAAQLDLWTNLTFRPDEPLGNRPDDGRDKSEQYMNDEGDEDGDVDGEDEGTARIDGHTNVVNPQVIYSTPAPRVDLRTEALSGETQHLFNIQQSQEQHPFDLNSVLAGFGIDPYLVPQVHNPAMLAPLQQSPAISLAQLLAAYPLSTGNLAVNPNLGVSQSGLWSQASAVTLSQMQAVHSQAAGVASSSDSPPTAKKTRTRKTSISSTLVGNTSSMTSSPASNVSNAKILSSIDTSSIPPLSPNMTTPLTPAEDKRRRNTAASARFRLKKKEREAALETKSKELESRVGELERECENLRRENGWLKGLVVGVAGGGNRSSTPPSAGEGGAKRKREAVGTEKDLTVSAGDVRVDA